MIKMLIEDISAAASPQKAKDLSRFLKTGKGEYGEGDIFLGVTVPVQRKIARKHSDLPYDQLSILLKSKIHEHRLTALLISVIKYQKADDKEKNNIYTFYLRHIEHVNNWDLVDLSADKIMGSYLWGRDKTILYKLAKSDSIWERRISIISTFSFIKKNEFKDTFSIAEILLNDNHDLIHKAVGWMLREVGKRDQEKEEVFLKNHYQHMPRTMLRYAIEKFDKDKRAFYMRKRT